MKSIIVTLVLVVLSITCVVKATDGNTYKALNAALSGILTTDDFKSSYTTAGYATLPTTCTDVSFPSSISKTEFTACKRKEDDAVTLILMEDMRQQLETALTNKYKKTITVTSKTIETSGSFFAKMGAVVNAGECDFALSPSTVTDARKLTVTYLCPFAVGASAMLRGTLESDKNITNGDELNQSGIKVAVEKGSSFADWASTNLPKVTVVPYTSRTDAFTAVVNGNAHVVLHSERLINLWKKDNNVTLPTYSYGATQDKIGLFVSLQSSASRISSLSIVVILVSLFFSIL
jgi:hypothetical protein